MFEQLIGLWRHDLCIMLYTYWTPLYGGRCLGGFVRRVFDRLGFQPAITVRFKWFALRNRERRVSGFSSLGSTVTWSCGGLGSELFSFVECVVSILFSKQLGHPFGMYARMGAVNPNVYACVWGGGVMIVVVLLGNGDVKPQYYVLPGEVTLR